MTNLSALEATLKAIQAAYTKLDKGKLSAEEIDTLVENSKELYERAVILRYKVYEEKIFGVKESVLVPDMEKGHKEISKNTIPEVVVEIPEENQAPIESLEEDEDESPAFDFSLFDDSTEVVKNEELKENAIEHISVTSTSSDDHGLHEDKIVMEQVTVTPVSEDNVKFIQKFTKTDPQLRSQIELSKLDSLIGSFGLNERLQFINELFDGSSEVFAEAVKTINQVATIEEALLKASVYANQFQWDYDSETVEEFVVKIKRRYA